MLIDYKTLKQSADGMPTWDSFFGPVMVIANTKDEWKRNELIEAVIDNSNIPKEIKEKRYSSKYHDLILKNRISWSFSDLKMAGLLITPKRGIYKVSSQGKKLTNKYDLKLNRDIVYQQDKFQEHKAKKNESSVDINDTSDVSDIFELSKEQIDNWFDKYEADFKSDLLNKLRNVDPYQLEIMMTHLLAKMGYKGVNGEEITTQKSNDGGIDGIINRDALGLETVYIQVKRYAEDNTVSRPEINGFYGAIKSMNANSGVFITTSSFTKGAKDAAKHFNIALVDGEMLTNLMIQYHVGVKATKVHEFYDIDDDFFSED